MEIPLKLHFGDVVNMPYYNLLSCTPALVDIRDKMSNSCQLLHFLVCCIAGIMSVHTVNINPSIRQRSRLTSPPYIHKLQLILITDSNLSMIRVSGRLYFYWL